MIRIPSFMSYFFLTGSDIIVTYVHNASQVKGSCRVEKFSDSCKGRLDPAAKASSVTDGTVDATMKSEKRSNAV